MPRKKKLVATKSSSNPGVASCNNDVDLQNFDNRLITFNRREVECRIAAIQAIQAAEVQNMLARLRMLRSYLSKEQLQAPALNFFEENLPNMMVIRNEEYKVFELRENEKSCLRNGRSSVSSGIDGLPFSMEPVKHHLGNAADLEIPDFALDGFVDNHLSQMLGVGDSFQTPGAMSSRSSFGTAPRTARLPMQGEMLLSVHGSPLGVYKEDRLEAIHESGDDPQHVSLSSKRIHNI